MRADMNFKIYNLTISYGKEQTLDRSSIEIAIRGLSFHRIYNFQMVSIVISIYYINRKEIMYMSNCKYAENILFDRAFNRIINK